MTYLKFTVGDEGAAESDTADVSTEEEGGLDDVGGRVGGKVGIVDDIGAQAGEHGGGTDERVESGDELRQVGDLDLLGDGRTDDTADAHAGAHLDESVEIGLHDAERGSNAASDADLTEDVAYSTVS